MRVNRTPALCATILAAGSAAASVALAGTASGPHETVTLSATSLEPGTPTGSLYDVRYRNPSDPSSNPPAVRRLVAVSPAGTRIDTSVPARCEASDAELKAEGDAACPSASRIGGGTATISVLGGAPSTNQVSVYNTRDGFLQLVKFGGFGVGVARTTIRGTTLDTRIPTCIAGGQPPSGCPSDQAVVLASRILVRRTVVRGRSYATTPPTCPRPGWPTKLSFYFGDGTRDSVTTVDRCRHRPRGPLPDHDWHPAPAR